MINIWVMIGIWDKFNFVLENFKILLNCYRRNRGKFDDFWVFIYVKCFCEGVLSKTLFDLGSWES